MMAARNPQILRTIALLIAVCLVSMSAQAQYGGGTGEPNDPYQIATAEDLNEVSNHPEDWHKCFVLVNDVDMAGFPYATALIAPGTGTRWGGFEGTPFTGIFDGNGHAINNLTIDTKGAATDYLGLFGKVGETGQVKNLAIEDVNIAGGSDSDYLGGLAG